jgi:hypothetical protein
MSNKLYDVLKFLAQIALPAVGTLYVTLAALWDLPKPQEVLGTILAIDTFLGILLGLQSAAYNKGVISAGNMNVTALDNGGKNFSLDLDHEPEELEDATEVRFRVKKQRKKPRGVTGIKREAGLALLEVVVIGAFVLALLALLFAAGVLH